jgi:hypothetical protein
MAVLQQALVALAASAALPASTVSYINQYSATITGSTASQTAIDFGVASSNRLVLISVFWLSASPFAMASATIGGIAATIATTAITGPDIGGNYYQTALIAAIVPTGTSGTVSATFGGTLVSAIFRSFNATNISTATPFSVATPQAGAVSVLNTTVDEAAGGAVFAAVGIVASGGGYTLTGITQNYTGTTTAGGSDPTPSAVTGAPISFTASGSTYRCLIAASFR